MNVAVQDMARNSPGWAFDRFRSDALPRLLDDLGPVNHQGIDEADCQRIKAALNEIANQASNIPDGTIFRKAIYQHLETYFDLYSKWNDVKGIDRDAQQRRNAVVKEIRACRHALAKACRKNIHVLNKELDLKNVDSFYAALRKLVQAVACTWFRRHRVRCFNGTGGASWNVGSLRGSSSLRLCG
jgi:hypothetical protein